jgi:flagellar biogenesis protein FliO
MYLVTAEDRAKAGPTVREAGLGGLAGLLMKGWAWWQARGLEQQRRTAKRQLFLLETMVLGPKQRLVLMRCGTERFLVGMGAEGVTSVVRLEDDAESAGLPLVAGGEAL